MTQCNRAQHIHSQSPFVDGVGRSRDIDDDTGSLRRQFGYRVAIVAPHRPEILIVPDVFTNRNSQFFLAKRKNLLFRSRLKISRFVEHVIRWQQHFALLEYYFPVADQRRLV